MKFKRVLTLILLIFISSFSFIRAQERKIIQFSGVLYSADTAHRVIPFATIYDYTTGYIAISNFTGFFSLVGYEGDSIFFSTLGFKTKQFIIPKEKIADKYAANFF